MLEKTKYPIFEKKVITFLFVSFFYSSEKGLGIQGEAIAANLPHNDYGSPQ